MNPLMFKWDQTTAGRFVDKSKGAFTPDVNEANKSSYSRVVGRLNILSLLASFVCEIRSGGQSTQIKYLSKSTDTYNKILLQ